MRLTYFIDHIRIYLFLTVILYEHLCIKSEFHIWNLPKATLLAVTKKEKKKGWKCYFKITNKYHKSKWHMHEFMINQNTYEGKYK